MTVGTVVVLALQGPLTSLMNPGATAVELLTRIQAAKPRIILDLGAVLIVDCSGIGLIAALYRAARDLRGDVRLLNLRERPRQLLKVCGLLRVIQVFETEEDALASIVSRDDPELYLDRAPLHLRDPWSSPAGLELTRMGAANPRSAFLSSGASAQEG